MKAMLAITALLVLGATAQAKVAPFEGSASAITFRYSAIAIGPAGALLEAEYFRAPPPLAERNYPCRLQLRIFEKTRLAQSCQ